MSSAENVTASTKRKGCAIITGDSNRRPKMSRLTYDEAAYIANGDNDYVERALRYSKQQQWGFVIYALGYIFLDGEVVNVEHLKGA